MKKLFAFCLILPFRLLAGCDKYQWSGPPSRSFVTAYCIPDEICFEKFYTYTDSIINTFSFKGEYIYSGGVFEELSRQNNDFAYNKPHNWPPDIHCLYSRISFIKVETLGKINESYPEGSDVSELIECDFKSVEDFIQNGYNHLKITNLEENFLLPLYEHYEMVKRYRLDEIDSDKTHLAVSTYWVFQFMEQPDTPGDYEFKLIVGVDGKEITSNFTYSFM